MNKILDDKTPIRRALLAWYRRNARDLPWRGAADPYRVWVTEIILQQTRVDQGTPYIERFFQALPDVQALAATKTDRVLKLWEGLGYYARARNLHKAAQRIVRERGGVLPDSAVAWRELPGVGRYTAGAIASIAFDERTPAVDGNVKRVLSRWTDLKDSVDDSATVEGLWDLAGDLVHGKSPGDFNQALMELGAQACTPKKPDCGACPVSRYCRSLHAGTQEQRPVRRPKKKIPHHEIVVAAIRKNGRYLIGKRPPKGLLGGLWEFPGGKVEPGETHAAALRREIREEVGITVKVGALVASVKHAYSHFKITLTVYNCVQQRGTPQAKAHTELKWVLKRDFKNYTFPKANHKFLDLL